MIPIPGFGTVFSGVGAANAFGLWSFPVACDGEVSP